MNILAVRQAFGRSAVLLKYSPGVFLHRYSWKNHQMTNSAVDAKLNHKEFTQFKCSDLFRLEQCYFIHNNVSRTSINESAMHFFTMTKGYFSLFLSIWLLKRHSKKNWAAYLAFPGRSFKLKFGICIVLFVFIIIFCAFWCDIINGKFRCQLSSRCIKWLVNGLRSL